MRFLAEAAAPTTTTTATTTTGSNFGSRTERYEYRKELINCVTIGGSLKEIKYHVEVELRGCSLLLSLPMTGAFDNVDEKR
ncbi:hypothetical protein M0802_003419 [Mischocyttarus mexicanus]|nr:hypothetical protein M0802_003419 [Mischocyttarus mexicanus]